MLKLYVDGSWQEGYVGYGAVLLDANENIVKEWSGPVPPTETAGTRQVAGELWAVGIALRWCQENGHRHIHVFYDYKGIKCWATGAWKAKLDLTQRYQAFVQGCGLSLLWHKVAAHAGNRWNDHADALAKAGAAKGKARGLPPDTASDASLSEPPLMTEVKAVAEEFCAYLISNGLNAEMLGTFNQMFARVAIQGAAGKRLGLLDIYNTAKKPLTPHLLAFKTSDLEARVAGLWKAFRKAL